MRSRSGQSVMEYSLLLIIVMVALLTIQMYVKRGIQGRWKETVDELGDQYDPRLAVTNIHYSVTGGSTTVIQIQNGIMEDGTQGFFTDRIDTSDTVETKKGSSKIDFE